MVDPQPNIPGILGEIIGRTANDLIIRKQAVDEELLWRHVRGMPAPKPFAEALRRLNRGASPTVIAELKKASPSKGLIRKSFPVIRLARELEKAGADALSVLTEPHYFQGRLRNLRLVSDNVGVPILRKDFIIDPYQIIEARVYGASAVLLIMAALTRQQLEDLCLVAREVGLDVLLEVHTKEELEVALTVKPDIVGVNSRNLKTFKTDLKTTADLISGIPDGIVKVAESGIITPRDMTTVTELGADACLIGESLMRSESPGKALKSLRKAKK